VLGPTHMHLLQSNKQICAGLGHAYLVAFYA